MTEPFIDNLVKTYSETKDPELLKPWKEPTKWDALQGSDRLLVADLFLLQGEKALKENRVEAEENFLIAKRIGEGDPAVLYKIAAFYAVHGDLQRAIESLKELLKTEPTYVDARSLLASSLSELSSLTDDIELSLEADREFRLIQDALKPTSLWNWGEALHRIALDSGEVSDYFAAVEVYRKAASKGLSQSIFFNSFANALVELAMLVERPQLFEEAVGYYKKVVELDPHRFEGYINLACTESRLWFDKGEESHFYSAHKAFEKASQYDKGDSVLWQKWGVLLFETGKAKQNEKLLRASLEKFSRA